jgi:hypothetical protein
MSDDEFKQIIAQVEQKVKEAAAAKAAAAEAAAAAAQARRDAAPSPSPVRGNHGRFFRSKAEETASSPKSTTRSRSKAPLRSPTQSPATGRDSEELGHGLGTAGSFQQRVNKSKEPGQKDRG